MSYDIELLPLTINLPRPSMRAISQKQETRGSKIPPTEFGTDLSPKTEAGQKR